MIQRKLISWLLVLLLVSFLAHLGCSPAALKIEEVISKEANTFLVVDVKRLVKSKGGLGIGGILAKKLPFDLDQRLDKAVMVVLGDPKPGINLNIDPSEPGFDGYLVVEGDIYEDSVRKMVMSNPVNTMEKLTIRDSEVFRVSVSGGSFFYRFYAAFVNSDTAIASVTESSMELALGVFFGKKPNIKDDESKMARYNAVRKDHLIWGIFGVDPQNGNDPRLAMIPGITEVTHIYAGISDELKKADLDLGLFVSKPDEVEKLKTGISTALNFVKATLGDKPGAIEIVDSIKIISKENAVYLSVSLLEEQIKQIKKMISR